MHKIQNGPELAMLLAQASRGNHMARAKLKESLSTSDMPELFRQVTSYAVKEQYARLEQKWPAFSSRYEVPDFRPQRFMEWNLTMGQLLQQNAGAERNDLALPRVAELTEYPTFTLEAAEELFGINKYGARFPFSFEAFLNDEYQIIKDMPNGMAQMAVDTEDVLTTGVLAGATGPNPAFFNNNWDFGTQVPRGNILEGNPELSIEAVEAAIANITARTVKNRPVTVQSLALVVPPALEPTASRIAALAEYTEIKNMGNGTQLEYQVPNPVRGKFTVVVNPWLPLLDLSGNSGTTWYLVPSGGSNGPRRSIITTFLTGREGPELRVSGDTGQYVGGGEVPSTEGSFSHDDVQYRVRHITGAVGVDPSPTIVSTGTNDGS